MTPAPAAVILQDLDVGYARTPILTGVNLTIAAGVFTGLLGANGSGKSTLLRTILGIIPPLAGTVLLPPREGRAPVLGYVPQRESLDPVFLLSSFEVALMGVCGRVGPSRRIGRGERDWVRDCLHLAGASELANRRFSELSGGQKQRVLMARALVTRPDLLLLDEPISGIDANASRAIMELLRDLHQRHGYTVLMVSHDLHTVRRYAQQVIWLHQGKVLHGQVGELLTQAKIEEILDLQLY